MESILRDYFTNLRDKKIIVLGLGISNRPLVRLLLGYGCQVTGCDKTPREKLDHEVLELEELGCRLQLGENYLEELEADIVFRTPGLHPGNPAILALKEKGAEITSEMEVFFQLCPCRIIGITGSDGKTTTTTLISEILKDSGKTVWVGGNIGAPLLPRMGQMHKEDICVVELSSFQLMDMKKSPHIAVITNLAPNHLDVHKDMEEYVEAKKNIYRFQSSEDILITNADNGITKDLKGPGSTIYFSRKTSLKEGVSCRNLWISRDGENILNKRDILIPGEHNVENYMAAMAAVQGLASDESIRKIACSFGGVEHRIELVRTKNGVRFYNDSIASSPTRTIAGLRSFSQKVILIAGGYDKKIPYESLGPVICDHVKLLLLTGATGPKIRQAVLGASNYRENAPQIVDCRDLKQAVSYADEQAQPGDIVIMSPASASFDCYKNFMERGNCFKDFVKGL